MEATLQYLGEVQVNGWKMRKEVHFYSVLHSDNAILYKQKKKQFGVIELTDLHLAILTYKSPTRQLSIPKAVQISHIATTMVTTNTTQKQQNIFVVVKMDIFASNNGKYMS